jgi:CRP/FNR family transcriptional regulator
MDRFDIDRIGDFRPSEEDSNVDPLLGPVCAVCNVRHLSVCAPLGSEEQVEISKIVTGVELEPDAPLFDETEPAKYVYSITSGAMKIYKLLPDGRQQIVGFLFAGDLLGLASKGGYAYSAEALTHVTLCRFPRKELEELLARYPKMERRLLGMASHELAAAQEQMLLLGRKNAKEKIASFLLMLSQRATRRGLADNPISLPMSRTDIGDYLGLTTETVSRSFTQLKKAGLFALHPFGKVEFLDRKGLQKIADGY